MNTGIKATLLSLSLGFSAAASAADRTIQVEIRNATHAVYFTPLLVAVHAEDVHLFQVGEPASPGIRAVAEGGALTVAIQEATAAGAVVVADPVPGLLAPGAATTATLEIDRENRYLSIAAMLLPSNDGFVGLDGWKIPFFPGTYSFYVNGYDAGTEANDERLIDGSGAVGVPGMPADPSGFAGIDGQGVTDVENNGTVQIHRGAVGDFFPEGGPSDLDAGIHRWNNPVAKVKVTVQ